MNTDVVIVGCVPLRKNFWPTPNTEFEPFTSGAESDQDDNAFVLEGIYVLGQEVRWRLVPARRLGETWYTNPDYTEASGNWHRVPEDIRARVPECPDSVPLHTLIHKSRAQRRAEGEFVL